MINSKQFKMLINGLIYLCRNNHEYRLKSIIETAVSYCQAHKNAEARTNVYQAIMDICHNQRIAQEAVDYATLTTANEPVDIYTVFDNKLKAIVYVDKKTRFQMKLVEIHEIWKYRFERVLGRGLYHWQ